MEVEACLLRPFALVHEPAAREPVDQLPHELGEHVLAVSKPLRIAACTGDHQGDEQKRARRKPLILCFLDFRKDWCLYGLLR